LSASAPLSLRFDPVIAKAQTPFRLGLFGGTFDPVHIGHLHIATCACEQFSLDGVLFILAGRPIRKIRGPLTDAEDRYAMLKAVVAGNPRFDVSRVELDREGPTYTIDTLRAIQERYENRVELFFIVGLDVLADIDSWKDAGEIADRVTFLSAKRAISPDLERRLVHNRECFDTHDIDSRLIDLSSSGLREWTGQGRSIRYLVPDAAYSYIKEQGLYQG
jgi:nicotinate-nucleotide adenylyltransferase